MPPAGVRRVAALVQPFPSRKRRACFENERMSQWRRLG
jgi:hypothetical protein